MIDLTVDKNLNSHVTLLEKIIESKKKEVSALKQTRLEAGLPLSSVDECSTPSRCFENSLRDQTKVPIIAEIKFKSPSAGYLVEPDTFFDASLVGRRYQSANCACISVVTDSEYFGGSIQDLKNVNLTTTMPILRKDFIIDEVQLLEARESGASCVLLIVAVLGDLISHFVKLCQLTGIECLVEVHNEQELELALKSSCNMIGVNTRNLNTFTNDSTIAEEIIKKIPSKILKVYESGVKSPEEANKILNLGYDAILIGEALMRSSNLEIFINSIKRH